MKVSEPMNFFCLNLKEEAGPGCAEFNSNNIAEAMGDNDLDRVKKIQNQLG